MRKLLLRTKISIDEGKTPIESLLWLFFLGNQCYQHILMMMVLICFAWHLVELINIETIGTTQQVLLLRETKPKREYMKKWKTKKVNKGMYVETSFMIRVCGYSFDKVRSLFYLHLWEEFLNLIKLMDILLNMNISISNNKPITIL